MKLQYEMDDKIMNKVSCEMQKPNKLEITVIILLTLVITFMDISGIPSALFVQITFADVTPYIFQLMVNFVFIGILAFLVLRFLCPKWQLGLGRRGNWKNLKSYLIIGGLAGILSGVAFCFVPFDYQPTFWKILFEGVLYYIGVALVEELYVRGLFLNVVEKIAYKSPHKTQIAIIVSSVVFGVGHIPGMIGMGWLVILFKLITTVGMGLFLGTVYKKTQNLWIPILLHAFMDICALPYCFTTLKGYETTSLVILVITFTLLGIHSVKLMYSEDK